MDVDMDGVRCDAGPSKLDGSASRADGSDKGTTGFPVLYPAEMSGLPPTHLSGSQDLVTLFGLGGCYDKFVRPYVSASVSASNTRDGQSPLDVKGKGKAAEDASTPTPAVPAPGALVSNGRGSTNTADAKEKEKVRSMKKHYSHFIADVPGQNKLAKDHYMRDLLLNPEPPDGSLIVPFDAQALRDAVTLELGLLPEFDNSVWRADADERRKKKRRKQEDGSAFVNGAPSPANAATPGDNKKRRIDG